MKTMRTGLFIGGLVLAAIGCGGAKTQGPAGPGSASGSGSATTVLELGEMSVSDGKNVMAKIHADGSTEIGVHHGVPQNGQSSDDLPVVYQPGPTFTVDGAISFQGEVVARLGADGSMMDGKGTKLPIQVGADAVTVTGEGHTLVLRLGADAKLTATADGTQDPKTWTVSGADTAGKRKTVLVLASVVMPSTGGPSETPASTPPASTPPASMPPTSTSP